MSSWRREEWLPQVELLLTLRKTGVCHTDGIARAVGNLVAKCVEELQVYRKAFEASAEVSAFIKRGVFGVDFRLRNQLGASSERVASLIAEGFEQSSDRYFAQYCYRSKGSCAETRTQLGVARDRAYITDTERERLDRMYTEIAKMLSGLIDHLEREDRKNRRRKK